MKTLCMIFFLWFVQISFAQTKDSLSYHSSTGSATEFAKFKKLGDNYYENGYISKAIENYRKALQIKNDFYVQKKLAKAWSRKGYGEKAIQIYQSVLSQDSTNINVRYDLAILLAKKGRIEPAIKLLYALEKTDPKNPDYSYQIGQLEADVNRKLDAYLRSYHKDTTLIRSIYKITKLYRQLANFKDSARYFLQKGLALSPNHFGLLRLQVIDLYRDNKFEAMKNLLIKMDSIFPNRLFVKKNLGWVYLNLNQLGKADLYLNQAMKIDDQPIIYYYKGLLFYKQKKFKDAKYMQLIAISKKKVKNDKEYYQLGLIEKEFKHYKKALKYFQKAYKDNPSDYNSFYQMALLTDVFYKNRQKTIELYKKYLKNFSSKDKNITRFVKNRLGELKVKEFMKDDKK